MYVPLHYHMKFKNPEVGLVITVTLRKIWLYMVF